MKFSTVILSMVPAVMALPATGDDMAKRQSANAVTDSLLYSTTLPAFTARRNARNPATLDWTSDGCTSSPDNPFGFPFVPACHRHDFGYQNYRKQGRFVQSGKLRIDNNFKTDLYFQCNSTSAGGACRALADVYYAAVRAFGGGDAGPGKRDEQADLVQEYEEKVKIYDAAVKEAQTKGELPVLNNAW